jgi:hypothetical protein
MPRKRAGTQGNKELRSERVTLAVTPAELEALQTVAAIRGTAVGTLLRDMSLRAVVLEHRRMLRIVAGKVQATDAGRRAA